MAKNVMMVSRQNFDRIVFRDKLEKYHNSVRSKSAELEKKNTIEMEKFIRDL